jgi:AcrR family transcriptional regulator
LVRATRTRILEAAGRLAHERGPGGFSMDLLAKEAGVARATVYEHFRSKRAVLDALAASAAQSVALEAANGADIDPLRALRDTLSEVCRHWADNERTMREFRTLAAMTGAEANGDAIDRASLRKLVDALSAGGHLRGHWSTDDATDALGVLTSYDTFDRLRAGSRSPEQVESLLARLAISIVTPGSSGEHAGARVNLAGGRPPSGG